MTTGDIVTSNDFHESSSSDTSDGEEDQKISVHEKMGDNDDEASGNMFPPIGGGQITGAVRKLSLVDDLLHQRNFPFIHSVQQSEDAGEGSNEEYMSDNERGSEDDAYEVESELVGDRRQQAQTVVTRKVWKTQQQQREYQNYRSPYFSQKQHKKQTKRRRKNVLLINTSYCKYPVVYDMASRFGLVECEDDEEWCLFWTDYSVSMDRVMAMKRYQKINHFPGMADICRKDLLARNLSRMKKLFNKEYNIFPKTWCLPADFGDLQNYIRSKKCHPTFICKPESGCQGKGIFLTKNPTRDVKTIDRIICQQYLKKPFLIDGYKFDLRVYVLVVSCDPLRIFRYKEGLARFATQPYTGTSSSSLDNVYVHLTNYSINKNSLDFREDEGGTKRKIATIIKWLQAHGYDTDLMWARIDDIIIKTLISAHPMLRHNYRSCFPHSRDGQSACFELLGFDVILNSKLKPYLLEVNHSPSFNTDTAVDIDVKECLIFDTFQLLNLSPSNKKKCEAEDKKRVQERLWKKLPKQNSLRSDKKLKDSLENQPDFTCQPVQADLDDMLIYENDHLGGFVRIYPVTDISIDEEGNCMDAYFKYFDQTGSLFQVTTASKAREECVRMQREEMQKKQEELDARLKKYKKKSKGGGDERGESPPVQTRERTRRVRKRFVYEAPRPVYDISKPLYIDPWEEQERQSRLVQRENLLRNVGVIQMVYEMLTKKGQNHHKTSISRKVNNKFPHSMMLASSLVNMGDDKVNCTTPALPAVQSPLPPAPSPISPAPPSLPPAPSPNNNSTLISCEMGSNCTDTRHTLLPHSKRHRLWSEQGEKQRDRTTVKDSYYSFTSTTQNLIECGSLKIQYGSGHHMELLGATKKIPGSVGMMAMLCGRPAPVGKKY